jgi:signal transduction histidine kinase
MQERAREFGATITIEGHPGRGTVVTVRVERAQPGRHGEDE